jgi:AcrR family transcriptional regulator
MSPRPATYTNQELLRQTLESVLRRGPDASFAEIGEDLGLTGARVGQLFGSREELFVAVARYYREQSRAQLERALALEAPPLERLIDGLVAIASGYVGPEQFGNAVQLLLRVPLGRERDRVVREYQRVHDGFIRRCLRDAIRQGDIRRVDLNDLVDRVIVMANGVYFTYILREGRSLEGTLRRHLGALLRPYRRSGVVR